MAHDYKDGDGVLISVTKSGLLYSTVAFKGCKKLPACYRLINLENCTVHNYKLYYKGSLAEVYQLFETWNDFGGIIYAPLTLATYQKEETDQISEIFDKAVGRI